MLTIIEDSFKLGVLCEGTCSCDKVVGRGEERRGPQAMVKTRNRFALEINMDVVIIIVNIVIITILTFALGLFFSFQPLLLLPLCTRASWTGNLENMLSAMFSKY